MRKPFFIGLGALLLASCSQQLPIAESESSLAREIPTTLITGIDMPAQAIQGQTVTVRVSTVAPRAGETLTVSIAGTQAATRDLIFSDAGAQYIDIVALRSNTRGGLWADRRQIAIEILPSLQVGCELSPSGPYTVRCLASKAGAPAQAAAYDWVIGGVAASSRGATAPVATVDLARLMRHDRESTNFTVSVTDPVTNETAQGEIVLGSHVYLAQQQNVLLPQVFPPLIDGSCPLVVDFEIQNPSPDDTLYFERYVRRIYPCDPSQSSWSTEISAPDVFGSAILPQLSSQGFPDTPTNPGQLRIAPGSTLTGQLVLPCEEIPPDTCAIEYDFVGISRNRRRVQSALWVTTGHVKGDEPSPTTLDTLASLVDQGLVSPYLVTEENLRDLAASGVITLTPDGWELN